jgi:hypothetical protein
MMAIDFDEGDKVECLEDNWYPAFYDHKQQAATIKGAVYTITGIWNMGGFRFLQFKETPERHGYMAECFVKRVLH